MSVNLSIKDVPDDVAERLRERAQRNHRSLQGELMAIVEAAVPPASPRLSAVEFLEQMRALGPESPSESTQIVRHMRDTRNAAKDR